MHYLVNVTKEATAGLYRMTYGRGSKQITAMCEEGPGGWTLMGHLDAGPYRTKRRAKQVFGAYAHATYEAGGQSVAEARRAGQRAVRALDSSAPMPEAVSDDPLINMAPEFEHPPTPEEIRKMSVLDEDRALALIRHNRSVQTVYGFNPWWPGDRKQILESGLGHLLTETEFERTEINPYIRA